MAEALWVGAGGILGLVRLLSEHGEAVEADLREHYGARLSDLFRGGLTWRELGVLVRQLPSRSRTRLATGDADGVWGLQEHLQALTIDELRVANWQRANEGVAKSKQSKPPKPVDRPSTDRKRADKNSPERLAKRKAALQRAADRRRAIAAGEIT
ncbi:hypothetical protein AB0L49_02245 [Streptomyces antimycoticus]|uniref:hypothetical protein n=1 Tax=Streptomyces antimycoticus TaxID=68175 RepID=UPI00341A148B